MAVDNAWYEARIARSQALIIALEDAIEALTVGGQQMYSLDTGQTKVMVQRAQLTQLVNSLAKEEQRLATYLARCGRGTVGRPGF